MFYISSRRSLLREQKSNPVSWWMRLLSGALIPHQHKAGRRDEKEFLWILAACLMIQSSGTRASRLLPKRPWEKNFGLTQWALERGSWCGIGTAVKRKLDVLFCGCVVIALFSFLKNFSPHFFERKVARRVGGSCFCPDQTVSLCVLLQKETQEWKRPRRNVSSGK